MRGEHDERRCDVAYQKERAFDRSYRQGRVLKRRCDKKIVGINGHRKLFINRFYEKLPPTGGLDNTDNAVSAVHEQELVAPKQH